MGKIFRLLVIAALSTTLVLVVSGCAKKKVMLEEEVAVPVETTADSGDADRGTLDGSIFEEGMAASAENLDTQVEETAMDVKKQHPILEGRTTAPMLPVYFDFDRSEIRTDQRDRIEKNGAYLKVNKMVKVRIEGNCDERGTNEYNLALGERRALSAQRYFVNLGIDKKRLSTISFGEEKPLLYGHDELSWAQNRRVDFSILD